MVLMTIVRGGFPNWSRSSEVTNQLRILEQPTKKHPLQITREQRVTASSSRALLCTVHTRWLFLFFLRCRRPRPSAECMKAEAGDGCIIATPPSRFNPIYGVLSSRLFSSDPPRLLSWTEVVIGHLIRRPWNYAPSVVEHPCIPFWLSDRHL